MNRDIDTFDLETAILSLSEIELFLDMYCEVLIEKPWTRIDKKRIEKLEYAFYMLKEQCASKKQAIDQLFTVHTKRKRKLYSEMSHRAGEEIPRPIFASDTV